MRTTLFTALIVLAVAIAASPTRAERATRDEALTVAKNWIALITHHKGSWGGPETAKAQAEDESVKISDVAKVEKTQEEVQREAAEAEGKGLKADAAEQVQENIVDAEKEAESEGRNLEQDTAKQVQETIVDAQREAEAEGRIPKEDTGEQQEEFVEEAPKEATVVEVREFKRGDRVIGYFCPVDPQGFIIVSLYKELAPVKAYSATCDVNPESDQGLVDVIKLGMEGVLDVLENQVGPLDQADSQAIQNNLEINYSHSWSFLNVDIKTFKENLESGGADMNYQEGGVLVPTSWHQGNPYNTLCPTGNTGCTTCPPPGGSPTFPSLVGCVATAGSQIMKYWNWPPYGVGSHSYTWSGDDSCYGNVGGGTLSATFSDYYNWAYIANRYVWDSGQSRWEDENGNALTQTYLDAVAELCYEVAVAVEMDFGVCGSGSWTYMMEDVYEDDYRYHTDCVRRDRQNYTQTGWYDLMKGDFNINRPIHYRISGHSIVADGWREIGTTKQYHMNYGWDETHNAWYTIDSHLWYDYYQDYLLENIYPAQALGSSLSGTYSQQSFPYRYFDRDATCSTSATFQNGQYLQFLPNITASCTSTTGGSIRFESTSSYTRLFTRGDRTKGIRIYAGAVKLNRYGSIAFR